MSACKAFILAAPLVLFPGWTATAETVYKHIDPAGNVTFSSDPLPAGPGDRVVPVEIEPPLSEEEKAAADQRLGETLEAAARLREERAAEEAMRDARIAAAEQELEEARAALATAKQREPEDWQHLAGGGRVLKPSYRDRVDAAEERVRQAEEALSRAREGLPPP
jgi:hypothetical protein